MIILKQVTHYEDTNSVEATWVKTITLPQQELEEGVADLVLRTQEVVVRCHSYSDVQMDMFRADVAELGGDIQKYEGMIAQVEAGIKPPPPKTPEQINTEIKAQIAALEATQPRAIREAILSGDNTRLAALDADIAALRTQLLVVGA